MVVGVAFFAGSAGAGPSETGLIAGYTAGLWGAYGLQKLSSLFAGSAIRVRRSSDNTESDIGFSGTALDTSSLATFVGSNDGFITKWYDQSGGTNDLAQSTTTKQPKIVDAGTYIGEILLDGVDDTLTTANSSGTPTAFTLYIAGRNRAPPQGALSTTAAYHYQNGSVGANVSHLTASDTYQTVAGLGRPALLGSTKSRGGLLMTRDASADSGTAPTGTFAAKTWSVGARSGGSIPSALNLKTLVIYETAVTDANIERISRLLG